MKHRKCKIITAEEYDGVPSSVGYNNDGHKYHKDHRGHYMKLSRKTCNMCNKPSMFVGIFHYKKHNRVERFCEEHAATFGSLPIVEQEQEQEENNITSSKEKLTIISGTH